MYYVKLIRWCPYDKCQSKKAGIRTHQAACQERLGFDDIAVKSPKRIQDAHTTGAKVSFWPVCSFKATSEARAGKVCSANAKRGISLVTRLATCRDCVVKTHGRFDRSDK